MAGAFRIAEGYVEVTADESAYDRAMDRLRAKRHQIGVQIKLDDRDARAELDRFVRDRRLRVKVDLDKTALAGLRMTNLTVDVLPKVQEAARRVAERQLQRLTADRTVIIRATVDTRVAADEIRNLTARRRVRIGVDVDTRVAADDIANLTRRRMMTVQARADTTDAANSLRFLTRDRTVNVRARMGGLGGLAGLGGSAGGVGMLSSRLASLAALAVGSLPTIASLAQSIAAMGPAALVAVPAVLSLGAAFTAIKVGMSGVGDAFKAAFAPATQSSAAATKSTRALENAQRSLAKAQQGVKDAEQRAAEARVQAARQVADAQRALKSTVQDVADANRRAAQQVAGAERDLADAQRAARQAQRDLNDARREAARDLEDLNNRLADAQLDQRQKVLDLQDAEQELAAVRAKGAAATPEEVAKAELAYDRAVQSLEEQKTETARLQEQTQQANAAGVEGSKTVVDAKQQIADANQKVTDETQKLRDAEVEQARTTQEGLQRVADAERDVADAREAARKAAVDGARDIKDAHEAVADAARSMADAQTAGAAATMKTADAMAKLAPNARSFVSAVLAQREAWRGLKLSVQNQLFAGLGQKFSTMSAGILPSLKSGLTGTAGVLNLMARNAMGAVTNLGKTGQIRKLFSGLNGALKPLAKVPGQFITGLAQIGTAASPAFKRVTTAAGGFFDRISKQIDAAAKNGHLEKIIDQALDVAKQFGHLIGDIFGTLGNVMKAASAGGADALGTLGSVFAELRRITALPEVQKALGSIFTAVNAIAKLFAGTLGAVIQAALPLLEALAPVVTELANKLAPVLAELAGALGEALMPLFKAAVPIIQQIGGVLVKALSAVTPLLKPVGELAGALLAALAPALTALLPAVLPLVQTLTTALIPVVKAIVPIVAMFGELLRGLAPIFPQLITALIPLIPPIAQLTVALLELTMQVIQPLMPLIVGLAQLLAGVLAGAIGILVPVITTVIGWLTKFTDVVTNSVKWVVEKFQWVYDRLVGHSIIPDLVNGIIGWFGKLWTRAREIFDAIRKGIVDRWNALWRSVSDRWSSFWRGLTTNLSSAKNSVLNWLTSLRTSFMNGWNFLWNSAVSKVTSIFTTLRGKLADFKTGMLNAVKALRDGTGTLFAGIQSKFAGPVRWVISHVYNNGLRKMWNTIAGKINSKLNLPTISLGFNKGGVVPGTGNSDTVPAMLTPGERILSNEQVTRLGGHRAIDAMLGRDQPTRTGGNPSQQTEKRRYQGPVQHFDSGGIVGKVTGAIGGAIGSVTDWAKDIVVGGLKQAAAKALSSLVRPLIAQIPGGPGLGGLLKGMAGKAVDGMMSWFGNEDKKAKGGPAVQRALSWARTQNGLPYQWGGNGNPSWDCSGLMSAIESVIRGERPHRRWATGAFVGNSGPSGWVRNLNSPFMIGITNAGVGHTAGTLAGVNVESRGGDGVIVGKGARSYKDSLFTSHWGFAPAAKYDSGGLLARGATMVVNETRRPERILTPQQNALFEQMVMSGARAGTGEVSITFGDIVIHNADLASPSERKRVADTLLRDIKEGLRNFDRARA
ncbi:hypothetical protein [Streptomyces longwoodensis]|uniref:hypothetical protein n=1 Tax=Streptomyces longwoodensis TaxID=68231 RepID=UPI0033EBA422